MEIIIAGAIAGIVLLITAAVASNDNARAQDLRQKAADRIGAINLPILDKLVAQKLPPDAAARYEKITESQTAESDALGKYKEEIHSVGETDQDKAAYLRAQQMANGVEASGRSAVLRHLAERGMAGSGVEAALMNQNAQDASNQASRAGVMEAGQSRERYMAALAGYGQLSSQMRGQEMNKMRAEDDINMFNARQQGEADKYNSTLAQREFDNKMAKASSQAGAEEGVANSYERAAGAAQQTGAGVANAAMTTGAAAAQYDAYGNPIKKKNSGGQSDWYNDSGGYGTDS